MKHHLNTLFIQTDGASLSKEGQTVRVRVEGEVKIRIPVHTLGGIVCFGRVNATTPLLTLCAEQGVAVSFLSSTGRLQARVTGFTPGNVLLRREQYRRADSEPDSRAIAAAMVAAKIANTRTVLLRATRDHGDASGALANAARRLAFSAQQALVAPSLDALRGVEGDAAGDYFSAFNDLISLPNTDADAFRINGRNRRPPTDPMNALLSFLYAMLAHDARSACEACGLDPAVGFLHRDRPGRPSLALDLMEELRALLCDRVALTLVNRRQVNARDFVRLPNGAVRMNDASRRALLTAYQERKQDSIMHPYLLERTTLGLLVHLQARLLSRLLRGELDAYPAFVWK